MRDSHEPFQNILFSLFLWCENAVGEVWLGWLGFGKDNGLGLKMITRTLVLQITAVFFESRVTFWTQPGRKVFFYQMSTDGYISTIAPYKPSYRPTLDKTAQAVTKNICVCLL